MLGQKRKHGSGPELRFSGDVPNKKQRSGNGSSFNEGHPQVLPPLPEILPHLAKAVFTHSSIATQKPDDSTMVNYERLEFLGDAHIELMATEVIFERYNSSSPGKMSALREVLCRNEVFLGFAQAYNLDKRLHHAIGLESKKDWKKISADVFEAYVAAIVLSAKDRHTGYNIARAWVTELWEPKLSSMGMDIMHHNVVSKEALAKSVLVPGVKLNYVQDRVPIIDRVHGKQTYFMAVYLDGWGYEHFKLASGSGESKNAASQNAAKQAMKHPSMTEIARKRTEYLEEREKQKAKELEAAELAKLENDVGLEKGGKVDKDAKPGKGVGGEDGEIVE